MKQFCLIFCLFLVGCATGNLSVTSNPGNADVYLVSNGQNKALGKTPLKVKKADLGESKSGHSLSISKPGYQNEVVTIDEGLVKDNVVHVELKKLSANEINLLVSNMIDVVSLIKEKKYDEATIQLNSLAAKNPNIAVIHELLGNIHYLKQDLIKARQSYNKAKQLNPNNPKVDRILAKINETVPPKPVVKKTKKDKSKQKPVKKLPPKTK